MIDRREKKPLRAWILARTDAELAYVRDELGREEKRRRLVVRARRKAARIKKEPHSSEVEQRALTALVGGSNPSAAAISLETRPVRLTSAG